MTKKKALRIIMSHEIQRNEAEHMLQKGHPKNMTNEQAVSYILKYNWSVFFADVRREKRRLAAKSFGVSFQSTVDALNESTRRSFYEDTGD